MALTSIFPVPLLLNVPPEAFEEIEACRALDARLPSGEVGSVASSCAAPMVPFLEPRNDLLPASREEERFGFLPWVFSEGMGNGMKYGL